MSFPNRPFAGKFSVPRILPAGLPVPQLSGLAKLPRPNFGNIVNSATRPSSNAIATGGSSATAYAGETRQPPPPPMRNFDTSKADRQIAASEKNDSSGKDSSSGGFDLNAANKEAIAGNPPVSTRPGLTDAQKKFQSALAGGAAAELWKDYRPEQRGGAAATTDSGSSVASLGKVNPKLYDQYGKLVSSTSAQDAAQNLVASGGPNDAVANRIKIAESKLKQKESEANTSTIEQLRNEIAQLRSRGTGSSDNYTLPGRSAIEIAGLQPLLPDPASTFEAQDEQPVPSMHRGFGDADRFASLNEPVSIPDPTAPRNLLRAAPPKTPGLVASTSIDTPRSNQNFNGSDFVAADPSLLPQGNRLGDFAPTASGDGSAAKQMVNNAFTNTDASPAPITTLSATANRVVREQELPLEISSAAAQAIAAKENEVLSLPVIDQKARSPFAPDVRSEVASASQAEQPAAPAADPKFVSAFGSKPVSPFAQTAAVVAPRQLVTPNRFFQPAVAAPASAVGDKQLAGDTQKAGDSKIAGDVSRPANSNAVDSAPAARVASVPDFGIPVQEQSVLEVEDAGYSPGSVKSVRKELW